jgi:uncharacterized protein YjiS (DUF1127 family)
MERPSQALAMRAPAGKATGLADRLEQWFNERAANDSAWENPASMRDADTWARHAAAANGFGDAPIPDTAPFPTPASYDHYRAARAVRSRVLGDMVAGGIQAVRAFARRSRARLRQRMATAATYDRLRELDDRTLRDLGIERGELRSIAAEAAADADRTRVLVR